MPAAKQNVKFMIALIAFCAVIIQWAYAVPDPPIGKFIGILLESIYRFVPNLCPTDNEPSSPNPDDFILDEGRLEEEPVEWPEDSVEMQRHCRKLFQAGKFRGEHFHIYGMREGQHQQEMPAGTSSTNSALVSVREMCAHLATLPARNKPFSWDLIERLRYRSEGKFEQAIGPINCGDIAFPFYSRLIREFPTSITDLMYEAQQIHFSKVRDAIFLQPPCSNISWEFQFGKSICALAALFHFGASLQRAFEAKRERKMVEEGEMANWTKEDFKWAAVNKWRAYWLDKSAKKIVKYMSAVINTSKDSNALKEHAKDLLAKFAASQKKLVDELLDMELFVSNQSKRQNAQQQLADGEGGSR